jgi:pantoate--beta-alanine ligase
MEIIRNPRIMQDTSFTATLRGQSVGLVPTMGALHKGHMSLIRQSRAEDHITVVSIFVNPTQFGPGEDYEQYPRDPENDIAKLREASVDILFMPDAEHMYPDGFSTTIETGEISKKLCGAFRPGHINGVATVVLKLLNIVIPERTYVGQKDYQQSLVIRRLIRDLNMRGEVVTCPTIREDDGLALSSRNSFLKPDERKAAATIFKSLSEAAEMIKSGYPTPEEVSELINKTLSAEPLISGIQYAGAYDSESLDELKEFDGKTVVAAAVKIGDTRLIDNIPV